MLRKKNQSDLRLPPEVKRRKKNQLQELLFQERILYKSGTKLYYIKKTTNVQN